MTLQQQAYLLRTSFEHLRTIARPRHEIVEVDQENEIVIAKSLRRCHVAPRLHLARPKRFEPEPLSQNGYG